MGGIKSNVSPLMADNLGPEATGDQIETAFRYFYWAINLGSLLGMLIAPLLKRVGVEFPTNNNSTTDTCTQNSIDPYTGYYVAYSTFTGIFIFGIVAYMWGYSKYISYNPHGSMLTRCISLCLRARKERLKAKANWSGVPPNGNNWLDWAKISCDSNDLPLVDDLKQAIKTCLVFLVFPVYWLLYLQMSNTLVLQAGMMYLPGNVSFLRFVFCWMGDFTGG
jgi:POT family proton-dependent oligopeptide transporter